MTTTFSVLVCTYNDKWRTSWVVLFFMTSSEKGKRQSLNTSIEAVSDDVDTLYEIGVSAGASLSTTGSILVITIDGDDAMAAHGINVGMVDAYLTNNETVIRSE
jgi:Na+/serine symporter